MSMSNGTSATETTSARPMAGSALPSGSAGTKHTAANLAMITDSGRGLRDGMFHFAAEQVEFNSKMLEEMRVCNGPVRLFELQQRWFLTNQQSFTNEMVRISLIMAGIVPRAIANSTT